MVMLNNFKPSSTLPSHMCLVSIWCEMCIKHFVKVLYLKKKLIRKGLNPILLRKWHSTKRHEDKTISPIVS